MEYILGVSAKITEEQSVICSKILNTIAGTLVIHGETALQPLLRLSLVLKNSNEEGKVCLLNEFNLSSNYTVEKGAVLVSCLSEMGNAISTYITSLDLEVVMCKFPNVWMVVVNPAGGTGQVGIESLWSREKVVSLPEGYVEYTVPNVVIYGNSGGIANHRDNAIITPLHQLSISINNLLQERADSGIQERNVKIIPYGYDNRISRHIWMLVADRGGYVTQFVKYLYVDVEQRVPLSYP